ncbi:MAG: serine/threonine-protein kinase, partial [Chloroflexota bacterium]
MQLENSINHRYIIRRKIGQGGMGAVYEAYDRLMQRTVALKTVLRQPIFNNSLSKTIQIDATTHDVTIADQPSIGESLLPLANEFQILATLRHPHIISVHDYGFDTQQNPYFTMDFLKTGVPMDTYCALASDDSKIRVLTEILQALIYLHRRQVLHCDLKPDNVIVTDDQVKVLDFGLSSLRSGADSSGGTLAYMAPELLQGGEVSIQSDLYAVGVIGFEMLSGLLPFDPDESSFFEDVLWHEADYFFVDAPEPVSSVLAKLMAKRPEDRYRSAEAALAALCRAAGQPIPAETTRIRESFLQNAVFVGRELERSKIQEILAAVKSGFNQTPSLLIGGESGVGKSRLIQECKTRALVTGLHVYEGQAQKDDGSGFVLWESIIERVILTYDISPDQLPVLKQIAPRIENMLGQTIPDPAPIPPDLANERLTRTILDLFGRINEPTLLILEDLQWYPDDVDIFERLLSLSELRHNLAIIGTYRNDEAPDLPTKLPLMESIILDRFSPIDIAALSQSMLGDVGLRPEIQKMLMAESEGNVFFLVEIVRALAEIAGQINSIGVDILPEKLLPKGILSIVENRLQQVPEALHGILKFSSVAGREIDVDLIKNYLVTARADCSVDEFLM